MTTKVTDQYDTGHNLPERVADSILEVHKVLVVEPKQIARVEVHVALLQNVVEPLLLRLLRVASVPDKGRPLSDPSHQ